MHAYVKHDIRSAYVTNRLCGRMFDANDVLVCYNGQRGPISNVIAQMHAHLRLRYTWYGPPRHWEKILENTQMTLLRFYRFSWEI